MQHARKIVIVPSSDARLLFSQMVARSTADDVSNIVISLSATLGLAIDRGSKDVEEMSELIAAGWITESPDGGWNL